MGRENSYSTSMRRNNIGLDNLHAAPRPLSMRRRGGGGRTEQARRIVPRCGEFAQANHAATIPGSSASVS